MGCGSEAEDAFDEFLEKQEEGGSGSLALSKQFQDKLRLDRDYIGTLLNPKLGKNRGCESDRANRAVTEQVLDPRIIAILCKLIRKQVIDGINGCISTGKEANVYHADSSNGPLAVKIYKSTVLCFKNRDRYVQGEYRWRHGYCRSNPRKMVQMWAEKEMRNLRRLEASGIPCPKVVDLKLQVLVMEFIGDAQEGLPAPRLKDATEFIEDMHVVYIEALFLIRKLFHKCQLVHADFSEYNLLWNDGKLVVIDVSQAVEKQHPRSMDFLRSDLANVIRFFREHGVQTHSLKQLFEWVVKDDPVDLERMSIVEDTKDEAVFKAAYIPQNLNEVHEKEALLPVTLFDKVVFTKNHESQITEVEKIDEIDTLECVKKPSKEEQKEQRKVNKQKVKVERRERRAAKKINSKNFSKK